MRQFFLKSVLSLSISVGALSASTNSTDLSDPVAPSATSSTASTSLALTVQERHPASIPMPFLAEREDADGKTQTVDVGFWHHPGLSHLAKQEIVSYLDLTSVYNFYRAGYINKWMWNALSGDTEFLNSDIRQKLFLVALAIQTKAPHLFLKEQAPHFAKANLTDLRDLFDSGDLRGYLSPGSPTREKYDSLRHVAGGRYGEHLRLAPPRDFMDERRQDAGRHVSFPSNVLTFLSDLKNVGEITEITVQHNRLRALPNLADFLSLETLQASNNKISRIEGLGQLPALRFVNLRTNKLSDTKDFEDQTSLESLVLDHNELQGALDLSQLTKMYNLELQGNQITEVKGLEKMTALSSLVLSENPISAVPSLRNHVNLLFLHLAHTGFTSLANIGDLPHLSLCDLSGNGLTSLESLPTLPSLMTLRLVGNNLTSLDPLTRLGRLNTLSISRNPLSTLQDLEHLLSLRTLNMRNMAGLRSLATMPRVTRARLMNLDVSGNTFIKMPEIAHMRWLEEIGLSQEQWNDRDNRLALRTLIENDDLHGRGPSVFVAFTNMGREGAIQWVRSRLSGEHGEDIDIS